MRADGKLVKNAPPMYRVAAYIMNKRYDAQNMITLDIPEEPMKRYLHAKRREGHNLSHLTLMLAAYLRTVAEYPFLNRFVVNKKIYARNEFCVGMVVLKPGELDGTMNKVYFDMHDTIFDVQRKMDEYIETNRGAGDTNSTDKLINVLLSIPGLVNIGVGLFRFMDRYGLLPKGIINASPFHTSMVISNLASIRTNHIYHHIYEFGTTSILMTMGNLRYVPRKVKGEMQFEHCMPLGVVMDERICSGSYYALAFKRFQSYLNDPTILEQPPEVVNKDV